MLEIKREIEEIKAFYDYDTIIISIPETLWVQGNFDIISQYAEYKYIRSSQCNFIEIRASLFEICDSSAEVSQLIMIEK